MRTRMYREEVDNRPLQWYELNDFDLNCYVSPRDSGYWRLLFWLTLGRYVVYPIWKTLYNMELIDKEEGYTIFSSYIVPLGEYHSRRGKKKNWRLFP